MQVPQNANCPVTLGLTSIPGLCRRIGIIGIIFLWNDDFGLVEDSNICKFVDVFFLFCYITLVNNFNILQ